MSVLRRLLSSAAWMGEWEVRRPCTAGEAFDFQVLGLLPQTGPACLLVVCRTINFQPGQFKAIADRPIPPSQSGPCSRVLAAPRISDRMAELCVAHGWSWFDLAGNCRLEVPGFLLIERSGNCPVELPHRLGANLGTPEASAVVRALLAPENAGQRWTQRGIARHLATQLPQVAPPSLGLVNKVIRYLQELECIADCLESRTPSGIESGIEPRTPCSSQTPRGFRVCRHEVLLDAWRQAYRFNRHVRRPYSTSLHPNDIHRRLGRFEIETPGRAAYAAFSAARPESPSALDNRTWLYIDPNVEHELAMALDATPVEAGGNLVFLLAADPWVFYGREVRSNHLAATHPAQTLVDLVSIGEQGAAVADEVLERRLKPGWTVTSAAATDTAPPTGPAVEEVEQLRGSWWL